MLKIAFPTHPTLNNRGQFDRLGKDAQGRWFLIVNSTGQRRELQGIEIQQALEAIVIPLLA